MAKSHIIWDLTFQGILAFKNFISQITKEELTWQKEARRESGRPQSFRLAEPKADGATLSYIIKSEHSVPKLLILLVIMN